MSDSRVFVDTNIFLYAALEDDFQQGKRAGAVNLLKGITDKLVYVNTQVLHEFYSIMLRHGQATKRSTTGSTRSSGKQRSP